MLILAPPAADSPIVRSEFVFAKAPFRSCHASTIAETKEGLVAAWFGGDHEGARDVAIYVSRRGADGWSAPVKGASDRRQPCWNPVLFQPTAGPLLLFYKVGPNPSSWWGMEKTSDDGGRTWSRARKLPKGILGPVKDKPLAMPDGGLLCPSSEEAGGWRVHMERTADGGATWSRTGDLNDPRRIKAIQPSLVSLGGDRVRALGRTKQGYVFAMDSDDAGRTWGAMRLLDVPNPDSGLDAMRLADGRFLMVLNDVPKGRTPLTVMLSDDAERWRPVLALETDPGEYSYPAVVQARDGLVHVTYTWRRERIRHVEIDPRRL